MIICDEQWEVIAPSGVMKVSRLRNGSVLLTRGHDDTGFTIPADMVRDSAQALDNLKLACEQSHRDVRIAQITVKAHSKDSV